MSPRPPNPPTERSSWLLRRADQAGIAVLVAAGLAATVGWWVCQGGWRGRLIEVEQGEPQTAAFQVDINGADWPELVQLPGVGKNLAQRIVESRRTQGPFVDHEDLRRVRGIGPKTLENIRPYLRPMPGGRSLAGGGRMKDKG
ncbi:MAG: helix-hairpin-helix domain-containing protein [Thermoguttaceae bacterium]|jgi:competence protein ComEA